VGFTQKKGDLNINSNYSCGVRALAVFETLKGVIVLFTGFGLFSLGPQKVQTIAELLVRYSHLNPARHYPQVFIEASSHLSNGRLRSVAVLAFLYATFRLVEAYGLWRMRAWAEWFAILSGAIYLPIEVQSLIRHASLLREAVLLTNVFIVVFFSYRRLLDRESSTQSPVIEAT